MHIKYINRFMPKEPYVLCVIIKGIPHTSLPSMNAVECVFVLAELCGCAPINEIGRAHHVTSHHSHKRARMIYDRLDV